MSYLFEMHYHTPHTSYCGKIYPKQAFRYYAENGYNGVVVTDHYYKEWFDAYTNMSWKQKIDLWLFGYINAKDNSRKYNINVILGMELRFNNHVNDFLVYGLDEQLLYTYPELYKMTPADFRIFADKHKLLFAQAHPFRIMCEPCDPILLHGAEVYNGNVRHNNRNNLAGKFAADNNLIKLSGSDCHELEDVCRGGIYLSENPESSEALARLLFAGGIEKIKLTE